MSQIYKPVPKPPITVEATMPCNICKKDITHIAKTDDEKRTLYASLKLPWFCDTCTASSSYFDCC